MKVSIRYGSHLPVLTKLVQMTDGPILELGIGLYSTPYLHYACLPAKRSLTSYESDPGWMRYFRDCNRSDFHKVHLIEDWDKLEINQLWDIAFVDHSPDPRRSVEAKRLANHAKYIILHDTDPETDNLYKYSEIYPFFKHRFDYTHCSPHTTVLSNFVALENLL